jgi:D-proline reductase (dithiol) PrdB
VGLVANGIEGQGIPTLVIGTVRDIMAEVRSPRAVFVDYPAGRTFGRPGDVKQHETVLAAALSELPRFTEWGQIRDLPFEWDPSNQVSWHAPLREELLRPLLAGPIVEKVIRLRPSNLR